MRLIRREHRWLRAFKKATLTVKVTGWSSMAGAVTVIVAPKDHPPAGRWWGATAWKAKAIERRQYEEGR
jgi:hypothetical protein